MGHQIKCASLANRPRPVDAPFFGAKAWKALASPIQTGTVSIIIRNLGLPPLHVIVWVITRYRLEPLHVIVLVLKFNNSMLSFKY